MRSTQQRFSARPECRPIIPGSSGRAAAVLLASLCLLAAVQAPAQLLTRSEAVTALLAPGSGVTLDLLESGVWSPYTNFGAGAGREGLLAADSTVNPSTLGFLPYPGPGMAVTFPAYFFWVDDLPAARFQHPVRFVLVRADVPSPTVDNGGIQVTMQGWWPSIVLPNGDTIEFFNTAAKRISASPPGPGNPDGFIAGVPTSAPPASLLSVRAAAAPPPAAQVPNNACGILVLGHSDFANDVDLMERDLLERVDSGRIARANGGAPASKANLEQAIADTCARMPACDKIYVRISSHGSIGGLTLADGSISAADL